MTAAYDGVCARLLKVTGRPGQGGSWCCPGHDDRNPSLSVSRFSDGALLCCHGPGCSVEDIMAKLELPTAALFDDWWERRNGANGDRRRQILRTHDYVDENGVPLYQTVRFDGTGSERFRQRRPDGKGGWVWGLGDVRRVLYRWPDVIAAIEAGEVILLPEGEHDADALTRASGVVATTNALGAGNWRPEYTEALAGAKVAIVIDADETGRKRGLFLRDELSAKCEILGIYEPVKGKDAAQVLGMGYDLDTGFRDADLDEATVRPEANGNNLDPDEKPPAAVLPPEFWEARESLRHIRQAARARGASPDAVLGAVLAGVALRTPPEIVLPAIVGGRGSLNLAVALLGASGTGKGVAMRTADELLPERESWAGAGPPGTGQGMLDVYFERIKEDDQWEHRRHRDGYLFESDEGQVLSKLGEGTGSLTLETMRLSFNGERCGTTTAGAPWRVLGPHSYRMCWLLGFQPAIARPLLADTVGGTPQRFLWFGVVDPDAPVESPKHPEKLKLSAPWGDRPGVPMEMRVAPSIVGEIRARRREVLTGQRVPGAYESHRDLLRLKVAAVLGILADRLTVTVDDWALAGMVLDNSDSVRDATLRRNRAADAAQETERNVRAAGRAKAEELARRSVNDNTSRVARVITRRLIRHGGPLRRRALRDAVDSKDREWFEDGLTYAEAVGWINGNEHGAYVAAVEEVP